jgi:hypothetical protein
MSEAFWASMQPAAAAGPGPTPPMPDYQGMFNQACDQVADGVKTVIDKFNAAVRHINDNRFLLGPALLLIKGCLDKMREVVDKVAQFAKYLAEHHIPVLSLMVQSLNWVSQVHGPMSDLSAPAGQWRDDNQNAQYWSGPAAEAYKAAAGVQKAAIDEYVKKSEFISDWLFGIVKTNVDYAAGLAGVVAKIAGSMVTTTLEGATVIELPFAADRLADTLNTLIEEGIKSLIQYAVNFVGAIDNYRRALSQQGDHTNFPGGQWPQAVRN